MSTLFFASDLISEAQGNAGTSVYAMKDTPPSKEASGKAYQPLGVGGLGYATQFRYTVPVALELAGSMTAKVFVSCDYPTVFSHGQSGATRSSIFSLLKGTTVVKTIDRADAATPCTGPTAIRELTYTVDVDGVEFKAKDVLAAQFTFFVMNTPNAAVKNVHFLVDGLQRASSIQAVGLVPPSEEALSLPETFVLGGPPTALSVIAGNTTKFDLRLTNGGVGTANFTVSSTVVEGVSLMFEPASGRIGPNETATVTTIVTTSKTLAAATYEFALTVQGPNGGNATVPLRLSVTAQDGETATGGPTITASAAKAASANDGGVPAPGFLAAAAVLLGVILGRRRRAER